MAYSSVRIDLADGNYLDAKIIPAFPRYAISLCGRFFSRRAMSPNSSREHERNYWNKWRELKPQVHTSGYLRVGIGGRMRLAHLLVLATHTGPRLDGMECRHLDGNKKNNAVSNLAWGTRRENWLDTVRHGTHNCGSRSQHAKFNDHQVSVIRELRRRHPGKSGIVAFIARWFCVTGDTISGICTGVRYRDNAELNELATQGVRR